MIAAHFRLVVLLGIFLSPLASATDKTLIAALGETNYPPFYFQNPQTHEWSGISIDICTRLAAKLGYNLEFVQTPFSRVLASLNSGQADMACTLFNTSDRSPGVIYTSVPHIFEDIRLLTLNENLIDQSIDAIKRHYRVGGVRGYYYGENFIDDDNFKKIIANNDQQLAQLLAAKRIDVALSNSETLRYYLTAINPEVNLYQQSKTLYHGPIYIAFSRTETHAAELAASFTKALIEFQKTPEYQQLLDAYRLDTPTFQP